MDEYYDDDADLNIDDVREDFAYIWAKNIVQVELIRENNPQGGDYFNADNAVKFKRQIWLNLQGVSSESYRRMVAGIITPDATLHAYAKFDEELQNLDIIKFGNWIYRIENYNKSFYSGQTAFLEFDLKRIDKDASIPNS